MKPVAGSVYLRRSNFRPFESRTPQTRSTGLKCVADCISGRSSGAIWLDSAICKRLGAVGVPDPEGPAARLALVADHAADADRTVQHGAQQRRIVVGGELHAELFFDEFGDGLQLGAAHFERLEVFESALLRGRAECPASTFL